MATTISFREFILNTALNAVADGDATVSEDGDTIRWNEPDCIPGANRLIGVTRVEGEWAPLGQVGDEEPFALPLNTDTITDGDEVVGFYIPPADAE